MRAAQRRFRRHNAARRWVEGEVWAAMAASWREPIGVNEVRDAIRHLPEVRAALERMWPVLTPAELLHDLFGSKALLKLAARRAPQRGRVPVAVPARRDDVDDVRWTDNDVALLDEARSYLGARPARQPSGNGRPDEADEIRTYGHIVIDEVQDLTPMQLRMVARRSLNGSMTVVGDIAQATGALAPNDWDDVLRYLPDQRPSRVIGLSVGYRIPEQIMALANQVMMAATPALRAPTSVRVGRRAPRVRRGRRRPAARAVGRRHAADGRARSRDGNIAVVVPDSMVDRVSDALADAGIAHGRATRTGLDMGVTVVPVSVVKGLELDGVVVVEPARSSTRSSRACARSTSR